MVEKIPNQVYSRVIGLSQPSYSRSNKQRYQMIEEIYASTDGEQIVVSTNGKPIRVNKVISGNRSK
jgi:hypothetical protein